MSVIVAKNLPIRPDADSHCGNGVPFNFSLTTEFWPLHAIGLLSSDPPVREGKRLHRSICFYCFFEWN